MAKNRKTEDIHIRMTEEIRQVIEKLAEKERSSKTQVITRLIVEKARKEGLLAA